MRDSQRGSKRLAQNVHLQHMMNHIVALAVAEEKDMRGAEVIPVGVWELEEKR